MVNPAAILLPLYVYPPPNARVPAFTAIAANPSVPFTIIINPSSGPGGSCPDTSYIPAIAQLRTYPNVQLIGYVHVDYTNRAYSDVVAEIAQYNAWAGCTAAGDTHLDGIFFDEAPNAYSAAAFAYMSDATSAVRSSFPAGRNAITLNPGYIADAAYYGIADVIVAFENDAQYFSEDALSVITPAQRAKSAALVLGFEGSADEQYALEKRIEAFGFKQSFISERADYNAFPALWAQFVQAVAGTYTHDRTRVKGKGRRGMGRAFEA